MIKYQDLNENQKLAVTSDAKHLRIVAGAGSGKTRVLTMRIVYLIEKKNVRPSNILAITFTNKAAKEMKKRINEMLGDEGSGCWISTIHSLCMRILQQEIEVLGYPKNFTVVDSDDQKAILKEAYKLHNIEKKELPFGEALDYIANNKYERITADRAKELAYGDDRLLKKAKCYEYYETRLKEIYGLDFDDLILFTTTLFKKHPSVQEKWASRFHYIHVDEFQDIDKEQYLLIKQLSSVHDNVYVVGDPDQTIYTWRGADVNIIVNFDSDFKNTETIVLNENYRSTNNILSGANSVIKNNKERLKKELFSNNGDGEKILHKTLATEADEANYVAEEIVKLVNSGKDINDIACLYRSNYLSRELEKVLIENRIPYVIYGGIRFYERMEVKDILSYLRLIVKGDDLSFKRVINTPKRGLGNKTIDTIYDIAKENKLSMYETVKQGLYDPGKGKLKSFINMIEKWKDDLNSGIALDKLLNNVINESGYREMLEKDNETERLENVKSLIDDIKDYEENYPEDTLEDYLSLISLYIDKANLNIEKAVNLMTIHSAKGLEFDTVFVIGLSEGVFPSQLSMAEGLKGLEEERRLAYVAYTRAKNLLYLTDTNSFSFVIGSAKLESRFINEIDDSYITHLSKPVKTSIFGSSYDNDDEIAFEKTPIIKYKKGDEVIHKIFGEGIVVDIEDKVLSIAFPYPHGVKKILSTHSSISKKGSKDDYS